MMVLKYTLQTRIVDIGTKREMRERERPSERNGMMCEHFGPCGTLFHVYKLTASLQVIECYRTESAGNMASRESGLEEILWTRNNISNRSTIVRGATLLELWSQMITDEVALLLWTVQTSVSQLKLDCAGWWSRCWLCGVIWIPLACWQISATSVARRVDCELCQIFFMRSLVKKTHSDGLDIPLTNGHSNTVQDHSNTGASAKSCNQATIFPWSLSIWFIP